MALDQRRRAGRAHGAAAHPRHHPRPGADDAAPATGAWYYQQLDARLQLPHDRHAGGAGRQPDGRGSTPSSRRRNALAARYDDAAGGPAADRARRVPTAARSAFHLYPVGRRVDAGAAAREVFDALRAGGHRRERALHPGAPAAVLPAHGLPPGRFPAWPRPTTPRRSRCRSSRADRGAAGPGRRGAARGACVRLAVIPARGGSKRIPRKNIRAFAGKPMHRLARSTRRDRQRLVRPGGGVDRRRGDRRGRARPGAEMPFLRPAELADDSRRHGAVVAHAIRLARRARRASATWSAASTPPRRSCSRADLQAGLRSPGRRAAGRSRSRSPVSRFRSSARCGVDAEGGGLQLYLARADRPPLAGSARRPFTTPGSSTGARRAHSDDVRALLERLGPVRPAAHRVQDIDTEEDWARAEVMFSRCLPTAGRR